jgi:hypothetical protein
MSSVAHRREIGNSNRFTYVISISAFVIARQARPPLVAGNHQGDAVLGAELLQLAAKLSDKASWSRR